MIPDGEFEVLLSEKLSLKFTIWGMHTVLIEEIHVDVVQDAVALQIMQIEYHLIETA